MINTTISKQLLTKLAGTGAYQRGADYFKQGAVVGWEKKKNRIHGTVQGSKLYHVTLTLGKNTLEGGCDCPASEGFDFCKHCVAVALQYQSETAEREKLAQGNASERIQAYLESLNKSELVQHFAQVIDDDPHLKHEWSIKADVALGKVDAPALKKRITAALPLNRHLYRYPQVRAYFAKVESISELLHQQIHVIAAEKALSLIDYMVERIFRALETIDDSGGFRLDSLQILAELHIDTLKRIDWSKDAMAAYLSEKFNNEHDLYPDIPLAYSEPLGEEGLIRFYQLAQQAWNALPQLTKNADWEDKAAYWNLQNLLSARADDAGDLETLLKIKQKTATTESDFLNLCELCLQHHLTEQADYWLMQARKERKDVKTGKTHFFRGPDRLDKLQISLYLECKEFDQALALQWRLFCESPSLEEYRELLQLEKHTQSNAMAVEAKHHLLNEIRSETLSKDIYRYQQQHLVDTLLHIYIKERNWPEALNLAEQHSIHPDLLVKLARGIKSSPTQAQPLYRRAVNFWVRQGKNSSYQRAVQLLREFDDTLQIEAHQRQFQTMLDELRKEFKPKRNFIAYLDEAF